jgi:hypothetical protein
MPLPPPVMIATFPANRMVGFYAAHAYARSFSHVDSGQIN